VICSRSKSFKRETPKVLWIAIICCDLHWLNEESVLFIRASDDPPNIFSPVRNFLRPR
jgi:hypothetical protein